MDRRLLWLSPLVLTLGSVPARGSDFVVHETARLVGLDTAAGDLIGSAVAIDGMTIVAGAPQHDAAGLDAGAAYVFERAGTVWTQTAKLVGSDTDADDRFGFAVAVNQERIVVGAPFRQGGGPRAGAAYVFERAGTSWAEVARIEASDMAPSSDFGWALAAEGDSILVGSPSADGLAVDTGAAYVFRLQNGNWAELQKLASPLSEPYEQYGLSLDLGPETLAIGAPTHGAPGDDEGAVYVYRLQGGVWLEQALLEGQAQAPSSSLVPKWMGTSVALDGDTLIAGSPRSFIPSGFVFERAGSEWQQTDQLVASAGGYGWLGHSASAGQGVLFMGAPLSPDAGDFSGIAAMWAREPGDWGHKHHFVSSQPSEGQLGHRVDVSATTLVAGALFEDEVAANSGVVMVFDLPQPFGEVLCSGDGSQVECPCGWNTWLIGGPGCAASLTPGAFLTGTGSPSVSADDLQLEGLRIVPDKLALLMYSAQTANGGAGLPFRNGLLCLGGAIRRIDVRVADPLGGAVWGPGLASLVGFGAGETAYFQVWYRDPIAFCGQGSNLSNAFRVDFQP